MVTVSSALVFFSTFMPGFEKPEKRVLRGVLFFSLGFSALFPFLHLFFFQINGAVASYIVINKFLGLICYGVGVLLYIKRIPESIWPGKFCYLGSSHQLWHVLIVTAVIFHYFAALDAYNSRLNQPICPA